MLEKIKTWYRGLPDKKKYIEFWSAVLTVPVLITVILVNLNNLSQKNTKQQATPTPVVTRVVETLQPVNIMQVQPTTATTVTASPSATSVPSPTTSECKKQVGPVDIASPRENEVVTTSSVCIDIVYQQGEYCGVVWSYALDNTAWSAYSDKEICLYNLGAGQHEVMVKIKSVASSNELILKRTFTFGTQTPSLSPTQGATSSATQQ